MIQGHVKLVSREHHKAIVHTEYDDLIVLRILDGARPDVGDVVVGLLDCKGERLVLDLNKHVGVRVFVENGRRLFVAPGGRPVSRHSVHTSNLVRRVA